jgi:hypothetical protein
MDEIIFLSVLDASTSPRSKDAPCISSFLSSAERTVRTVFRGNFLALTFGFFDFHFRLDRLMRTELAAGRRSLFVEHALSVHSLKLQFKDESEQNTFEEQSPVRQGRQSSRTHTNGVVGRAVGGVVHDASCCPIVETSHCV